MTMLDQGHEGRRGKNAAALVMALLAGLLLAMLTMVAAFAAQAEAVARVGPTGANGFPVWYQDANGTQLDLCLDGPPNCLAAADELTPPEGEAFWWDAEAQMDNVGVGGGGRARLVLAVEAAFADPPASDQMTFGRIRVLADNLRPNTSYKVTHPYGVINAKTDAGGELRVSHDVGCAAPPCDFAEALKSPVFRNFLSWNRNAPDGFLGDPTVEHKVKGSPRGTNFFLIQGPNVGGRGDNSERTDLFSVQGKLSN